MIQTFGDKATEDVFNGINSKDSRKMPNNILKVARRKLDQINAAFQIESLRAPPGNRLEKKSGDLKDFSAIWINKQYRIIFKWHEDSAYEVKIDDCH